MQRYRDFAPTSFDPKGSFLHGQDEEHPDRGDWFVVPVSRNRDSEILEESNFDAALKILGGESATVEVHRFGHWGPGWFEIILVHPDREKDVQEIQDGLEDYPVLDEDGYSEREHEENLEAIRDRLGRYVPSGFPEGWVEAIAKDLFDVQSACRSEDWSEEEGIEHLKARGWFDDKDKPTIEWDATLSITEDTELREVLQRSKLGRQILEAWNYHAEKGESCATR